MKKILTALTLTVFLLATTPTAFAADYGVELIVPDGKKSKETDVLLKFNEKTLEIIPDKAEYRQYAKTFKYSDIKIGRLFLFQETYALGRGRRRYCPVGRIYLCHTLPFYEKEEPLALARDRERVRRDKTGHQQFPYDQGRASHS